MTEAFTSHLLKRCNQPLGKSVARQLKPLYEESAQVLDVVLQEGRRDVKHICRKNTVVPNAH